MSGDVRFDGSIRLIDAVLADLPIVPADLGQARAELAAARLDRANPSPRCACARRGPNQTPITTSEDVGRVRMCRTTAHRYSVAVTTDATVLVTGGTGFLAGYCIAQLSRAGYRVRFTVRTAARARDAQRTVAAAGGATDSLTFAVADLTSDANWDAAVGGCDYVLHIASPFPRGVPKVDNEVIAPVRDAALRVLRAARNGGVRRVVLTSSFAAIAYGYPPSRTKPFTEEDWTNTGSLSVRPYIKSRALAERAAWDFAEREGGGMELAVVNPVGIFGPVLGPDLSSSVGIVKAMLEGSLPRAPRLWTSVVDVRDVADLHLRAMTSPKAAGERFLAAAGDAISYGHIAQTLRDHLGAEASRVPDRELSNWLVRTASPFVPQLRQFRRNLDVVRHTDAAKARTILDWEPRPSEDAIIATARSLLDLGLVSD
jgi:dihydroflavonol-4-reductase